MTSPPQVVSVPGIAPENQPAVGSAPGWPLVVYFHHVHPEVDHYTAVTPDQFDRALGLLLERFDALDPHHVRADRPVDDRPQVLVTFDDGYRDNLTHAAPILSAYGIRSVFFVVVDWIGRRNAMAPRSDFLDEADHGALLDAGHRLAAHSMTHRRFSTLSSTEAEEEAARSLAWAALRPQTPPTLFAFPYGDLPPQDVLAGPGLGAAGGDTLGFGTVRCAALPWSEQPHAVRRTYLPSHAPELWPSLINSWEHQWKG